MDYIVRQYLSLLVVSTVGGWLLYMGTAALSYFFLFDHRYKKHPHYIKNQVWLEIAYSSKSVPVMGLLTAAVFVLEVRGHSKLYLNSEDDPFFSNWLFIASSVIAFLMFTDCLIYWIHRGLHYRWFYKYLHKDHHRWKIPTPFASHAFHPVDGFLQSLPYHIYPFIFPLHKVVYLALFVMVNMWTVSIHDGDYRVPRILEPFINGSAHHTDHHLLYKYNYGQFFTLWDHLGGSYQYPTSLSGNSPLDEIEESKRKSD